MENVNVIDQAIANRYALYHGDSVEITKDIPDNSIHYTILGIDEHSQVQHGVLQFMMYVLDKEGYTDHGGSVGGCWLTKKGEMFMDVLDAWYKREHSEN
mgnify:CR=1 FL=1